MSKNLYQGFSQGKGRRAKRLLDGLNEYAGPFDVRKSLKAGIPHPKTLKTGQSTGLGFCKKA